MARFIWSSVAILKHAFVMWVAVKGRLMTLDQLNKWTPGYDQGVCCLCNEMQESHSHLFFHGVYSKAMLAEVCCWMQLQHVPHSFSAWRRWATNLSTKRTWRQQVRAACFDALVYHLWAERNSRRHGSSPIPAVQRCQLLKREVLVRVEGHSRKLTAAEKEFLQCLQADSVV